MRAKDLLTVKLYTIREEESLLTAANLMNDFSVRHLPVIDEKRHLVGIVSDRDIPRSLLGRHSSGLAPDSEYNEQELSRSKNLLVKHVMQTKVLTATSEARVGDIADVFINEKIDALPILYTDGTLQGIVTTIDLLRELRRSLGVSEYQGLPLSFHLKSDS